MTEAPNMFRKANPSSVVDRRELLGMGSFGAVYKGVLVNSTATLSDVAVKVISYSGDELDQLGRELYFLKNLSSPFIVKYVDSFVAKGELYILMELCDSGSLLDICQATKSCLEEPELKAAMACCISGLVHIHKRRSIHRDIKAGNILLSSRGKTMLSDFGVSTQLTDTNRRRTVIGTPYWMAPEILQETSYNENADVWSLGITIIECAQGQPPHFDAKPLRAMYMIASKPAPNLTDESKWSPTMIQFLDRCLQKDPYQRATSSELESHPWIQEEFHEILHTISNPEGASLQVLKQLAARTKQPILDMRRKRQENTDMSTLQTFEKIEDINTLETETLGNTKKGNSWRTLTMETEAVHNAVSTSTWNAPRASVLHRESVSPGTMTSIGDKSLHSRMSDVDTWNATSFQNANYNTTDRGAFSDLSTPENTATRPIALPGQRSKSTGGGGGGGGGDTLRNQMSNVRLSNASTTDGNTITPSAVVSSKSNTLANNSDKHITIREHVHPEQQNTLKAALESVSQANMRRQVSQYGSSNVLSQTIQDINQKNNSISSVNSNISTPRETRRGSPEKLDTFYRVSSPQKSVVSSASTYDNKAGTGTGTIRLQSDTSMLRRNFTWDSQQSQSQSQLSQTTQETSQLDDIKSNEYNSLSINTPNANTLSGQISLSKQPYSEPFLAIKKYDTFTSNDTHDNDFPPLSPSQNVLTCQEGNLKFDQHEIQFKMAIYGTNGRSTGCRMEVRFGNVGDL